MKAKTEERQAALKMRSDGCSVDLISKTLKVSKSSVSQWTRGVLTVEETKEKSLQRLKEFGPKGVRKAKENRILRRDNAFEYGRKLARKGSRLHYAGCMLYWAEGGKTMSSLVFTNTDVQMILFFLKFLTQEMEVMLDQIVVRVDFHGKSFEKDNLEKEGVENFWSQALGGVKKILLNEIVSNGEIKKKKNRHRYGMCSLIIHDVEKIHQILGSIEEYKDIELNTKI